MTYITSEEILEALGQEAVVNRQADGSKTYGFPLWQGDSTWNPASTHSKIHGPAVVTYTEHPDGAIEVRVEEWAGGRWS